MLFLYMSMVDDESDKRKLAALYERMSLKCLKVSFDLIHDQSLAEDAVHNAFLKVLKIKKDFFAKPCHIQDATIVIITRNKTIDLMRSRKNSALLFNDIDDEMLIDKADISKNYETEETVNWLKELIKKLPDIYKDAFELHYIGEFTYDEIATILNVTQNVVAQRISRAKKKLKAMIDEANRQ